MKILKSIGAVIAGFLAFVVLSMATDIAMQILVILPAAMRGETNEPLMNAVALAYRGAYAVLGGYLTARLAPSRPMLHIVVLMVLAGLVSVPGTVMGWSLGNRWYAVLLAIIGPLFVWLGSVAYLRRRYVA